MKDRGLTASESVWVCTFANNQFELDLGESLDKSPFHGALKYSKEVALFLDHNGSSLGRSWCNFELSVTVDTEQNRQRWKKHKEKKENGILEWEEELEESIIGNEELDPEERPLYLITPAGMVGTARVTSGTVLKALKTIIFPIN